MYRALGTTIFIIAFGLVNPERLNAEEVSRSALLQELAIEYGFDLEGLQRVDRDSIERPRVIRDVDKVIDRILSGYNYLVNYENQAVYRVVIVGKKPKNEQFIAEYQDYPEETPPQEPEPDAVTEPEGPDPEQAS